MAESWDGGGGGKSGKKGGVSSSKGGGKAKGGKGKDGSGGGRGGQKPTDDPDFVRLSEGVVLESSEKGVSYTVEAYVASGTFSRVYRVRQSTAAPPETSSSSAQAPKRRWGASAGSAAGSPGQIYAAKVMRRHDSYIQYSSDACKEGELLQKLEKTQREEGREVLTMRCLDSFPVKDEAGTDYWCLILEWLDASLFDVVKANGNRGLHLSMVRVLLRQLLEQLRVLQEYECTHTDIKHRNCCLADTSYYNVRPEGGGRPMLILANPLAKFIDYGNAVFEGETKTHPIHTKQFRCPEVLLNVTGSWGPPSDTWTSGITAAYLVSGQLIFNSHEPPQLVTGMVEALGPFPEEFLATAKDTRLRRIAEKAAFDLGAKPPFALAARLGIKDARKDTPEQHCVDLLRRMLAPSPADRISAVEALSHPFITSEVPAVPAKPEGAEVQQLILGGGR